MNKVIVGLVLLGIVGMCQAQTFDEWFEQNKTQKKYYLAQIAALQVYIGEAKKGYTIVESGLHTIRDIKAGEFNLHTAFYQSLESINPAVGGMAEVAEIAALQAAIIERFAAAVARVRQQAGANEVDYIGKVYSLVLSAGLADINSLLQILTVGKAQLSDDERIGRIRDLDNSMKDRYAFTAVFTDETDLVNLQREAENAELGTVKGIYGLP